MARFFMAFLTVVALLGGTSSFAQQADTLATVPLDTSPIGPPVPPGWQGYTQTAPPRPVETTPSLKTTHGNWEIRCVAENDCVMTQLHRRSERTADAVFTIIKPQGLIGSDGQPIEAFAEIVVPLGVFLPGGLGLKVDSTPAQAAPFERCIEEGCVMRAPISTELLARLKQGSTAYIVIFGGPEQPLQIPVSLAGFSAAFEAF